jgi:hypothetical protein
VNVEGWLEPTDFEDSDTEDEPVGEELLDEDQDPEFVERMAPLGLNALDEPEVGYDELAAFLEENLYDMDEDEWLDICKCHLRYYWIVY